MPKTPNSAKSNPAAKRDTDPSARAIAHKLAQAWR